MDADYPASHSMDSAFFAVDKDGNVGYFSTGEAGAMPTAAESGEPFSRVEEQLVRFLPSCGAAYDLAGQILPGRLDRSPGEHTNGPSRYSATLMFLKSEEPVGLELDVVRALRVPSTVGVAVVFRQLTAEVHRRLHESGECLGCFYHYGSVGTGAPDDLAARGLYRYGHLCENWIAGPYGREEVPLKPVHVDQLPPAARATARRVRFDRLRFAEAPHVQPAEHTECSAWGSHYLDSAGLNEHPLPGHSAEQNEGPSPGPGDDLGASGGGIPF